MDERYPGNTEYFCWNEKARPFKKRDKKEKVLITRDIFGKYIPKGGGHEWQQ
jgi:hypothetical protein